ncbi:MAG: hypothetical protein MHM6MM_006489 [Cercozoa sp. M6MM]
MIGAVNPMPFAMLCVNGFGGVAYAMVIKDSFLFVGNLAGALLGLYYSFQCTRFSSTKTLNTIITIVVGGFLLFSIVGFVVIMQWGDDPHMQQLVMGFVAVGAGIVFFASPLSRIARVIRSWNAASIYLPLSALLVVNSLLWVVYAMVLRDIFILVAYGSGLALNVITCIVKLLLPSRADNGVLEFNEGDDEDAEIRKESLATVGDLEAPLLSDGSAASTPDADDFEVFADMPPFRTTRPRLAALKQGARRRALSTPGPMSPKLTPNKSIPTKQQDMATVTLPTEEELNRGAIAVLPSTPVLNRAAGRFSSNRWAAPSLGDVSDADLDAASDDDNSVPYSRIN